MDSQYVKESIGIRKSKSISIPFLSLFRQGLLFVRFSFVRLSVRLAPIVGRLVIIKNSVRKAELGPANLLHDLRSDPKIILQLYLPGPSKDKLTLLE